MSPLRKRMAIALSMCALLGALAPAAALADPDFGPGNSSAGPNDGNAKCHPPGQTTTTPGCK
jgi:hypothetical protein